MIRSKYVYRMLSLAAIFSLLLPAATPPLVYATDVTPRMGGVIPGGEMQITTDPANQYDPAISGNIIVYTDSRLYDDDILYYDLAASSEYPVSTTVGTRALSDVSNGVIAYTDFGPYYNRVMIYEVATGTTTEIAGSATIFASNPAIDGTLVAWEIGGIHAQDLASGEARLVGGSTYEYNPAVADGIIAYQRYTVSTASMCDIYAYDWATGLTRTIEDDPNIDARNSDTNGLAVVYDGKDVSGLGDIYFFDLATGEEKRLVLPGNQMNPNISGDYVSFEEFVDGEYNVRLWHVPTGTVFDLGSTLKYMYLNDIDGNRVVYTGVKAVYYSEDIYMYTFETPTYTITATAGPGGSITPSGEVTVSIGENQGFVITPDLGYHILDVVVDGVSQGALSTYTFTSVVEAHTITVNFACGDIEVAPTTVQFGDVALGASATQIVTIQNVGAAGLTVTGISLAPGSGSFGVTSAPSTPFTLAPGATAYVSVAFTPTASGPASGTLRVTSDDPDEGLVEITLSGNGVSGETPPSEQLAGILSFFDESVADGTLTGSGPGNSAKGRLSALRNMLEAAGDLIEEGRVDEAIRQLQAALLHVDGQPRPPDFVTGPAAAELASMIQQLIASLGG
ncbi:MAG: choice-of-anchor D domain-containing protein [Candidatus Bathyarchaeota archaeon]